MRRAMKVTPWWGAILLITVHFALGCAPMTSEPADDGSSEVMALINLTANVGRTGEVELSWTTGLSSTRDIVVKRGLSASSLSPIATVSAADHFTDQGVVPSTTYYYRVVTSGRTGPHYASQVVFVTTPSGAAVSDAGAPDGNKTMDARTDAAVIDSGSSTDAGGRTFYVTTPGGSDSNSGTTAASPWLTLRNSIPKLAPGDTLIVSGRFKEALPCFGCPLTFNVSGTAQKPITIRGQNGTIDVQSGSGDYGNLNFTGSYLVFDGLDVTSSTPNLYLGGAFSFSGSYVLLQNSVFHDMAADFVNGGADKLILITNSGHHNTFSNVTFDRIQDGDLYRVWGHHNRITRNTITNNTNPHYDYGGKTQLHADLIQFWGYDTCNGPSYENVFENSVFANNTISGGMLNSSSTAGAPCTQMNDWVYRNNIFVGDGTQRQAVQIAADHMHVTGNVFYNMPLAIDIFAMNFGNLVIANNAFIGSGVRDSYGAPGAAIINGNAWDAAGKAVFSSDMRTAFSASTLLVTDPGFMNGPAGDFHLLSGSVLRGKGTNLYSDPTASPLDRDGRARPTTGAWDIGPYQFFQ